jgi:hypothetical protein
MRLGGNQPVYFPWLGYFDQMLRVDLFVIADEMPYSSSGWAHRNRVANTHGPHWLTLPVRPKRGQAICDVRLDPSVPWARKHLSTLRHFYAKGVDVDVTLGALEPMLRQDEECLTAVTIPIILHLAAVLGIETRIVVSSDLGLEARYLKRFPDKPGPTQRIVAYMDALGATELLEGESGQNYFDTELFRANGYKVQFHRYIHPEYPQLRQPFLSHMSALDLILCVGPEEAKRVLRSGRLRDG